MEKPILRTAKAPNAALPSMWLRPSSGGVSQENEDMPIIGEVRIFAGAVPAKWLALGSGPVSRVTYADLFAYLGSTWGGGDGLTTFGLPPAERVPIPAGAQAGLTTRALADLGGAEEVTLTATQSGVRSGVSVTITDPGHSHGQGSIADLGHSHGSTALTCSITDPGHAHSLSAASFVNDDAGSEYLTGGDKGQSVSTTANNNTGITAAVGGQTDNGTANLSGTTNVDVTGISAITTGSDAADSHENMPPWAAYNFAIYAGV